MHRNIFANGICACRVTSVAPHRFVTSLFPGVSVITNLHVVELIRINKFCFFGVNKQNYSISEKTDKVILFLVSFDTHLIYVWIIPVVFY